jgi:predicted nucleic acid-binding protein
MFQQDFAGRILPFDSDAALVYARIAAERRRSGRPISQFDAQIAAIARSGGAKLATRNVSDFDGCGLVVVDPWRR